MQSYAIRETLINTYEDRHRDFKLYTIARELLTLDNLNRRRSLPLKTRPPVWRFEYPRYLCRVLGTDLHATAKD
jgi:hypothetical protein